MALYISMRPALVAQLEFPQHGRAGPVARPPWPRRIVGDVAGGARAHGFWVRVAHGLASVFDEDLFGALVFAAARTRAE